MDPLQELQSLTFGADPAERRNITIYLLRDEDDIPKLLRDIPAWSQGLLDQVPEEYRDSCEFVVELEYGYHNDDISLKAEIFYTRPETDVDIAARIATASLEKLTRDQKRERDDRAAYKRLKAKYGTT